MEGKNFHFQFFVPLNICLACRNKNFKWECKFKPVRRAFTIYHYAPYPPKFLLN